MKQQYSTQLTQKEMKSISGGTDNRWDDGSGNGCIVISDSIIISPTVPQPIRSTSEF